MSLKCSLLGHRYGELEVEREREERGSEVVVTVREIEVCDRCGGTQVRSEAKEVTTVETHTTESESVEPEPPEPEPDAADAVDVTETDDETVDSELTDETIDEEAVPSDPADEDVEIIDEHEAADVGHDTASNVEEVEQFEDMDDLDPEQDDGIILTDDEDEPPQRKPGEWPDEPERIDPKDTSWVRNGDDGAEDEPEETAPSVRVGEGHFHCPKCSFETEVRESPLREGDICPSCKQGYLDRVATRKE